MDISSRSTHNTAINMGSILKTFCFLALFLVAETHELFCEVDQALSYAETQQRLCFQFSIP